MCVQVSLYVFVCVFESLLVFCFIQFNPDAPLGKTYHAFIVVKIIVVRLKQFFFKSKKYGYYR